MRLLLVRHGESVCGATGIVGGAKGCTGLTERGFAQSRALRDRLEREAVAVAAIVASTLPRAIQTAEVLDESLGLDVSQDPDLCELIPGEADGTLWNEWREVQGFHMPDEPDRPMSPGGESLSVFQARVRRILDRYAAEYAERTVIAVCHGGIIGTSLYTLLGMTDPTVTSRIDNTSITEWQRVDDHWHLARYNDVAHLQGTDLLVDA